MSARNTTTDGSSRKAAQPAYTHHQLVTFLETQPAGTLRRLYTRPSACLCIFRLVHPLQRQLIMVLMWLDEPIETSMVTSWITIEGRSHYVETLKSLARLHLVPDSRTSLLLNPEFKAGLRDALTGSGKSGSFGTPAPHDPSRPPISIDMLDMYALERWETTLHFMVTSGTDQESAKPSEGVLFQLEKSGLMVNIGNGRRQITSAGFQFLLHSPHTQLWQFILSYLKMMSERPEMDMVDILGLLFMLATTQLGQEYLCSTLTPTQLTMVSDLRDLGLVHFRKESTATYLPTRLATTLTSASPPLPTAAGHEGSLESDAHLSGAPGSGAEGSSGFIILETNYHLYAYTDNPLQIAVLNLFVQFQTRFTNLIVGRLTRDSVKKALANGITADQILSYLVAHAHPQMRKNNPIIPVTVQDQIRLWELEKHRVKGHEGYLYKEFASAGDYEVVLRYAQDLQVVLWSSSKDRMFFADASGRAMIRQFIERRTTGVH